MKTLLLIAVLIALPAMQKVGTGGTSTVSAKTILVADAASPGMVPPIIQRHYYDALACPKGYSSALLSNVGAVITEVTENPTVGALNPMTGGSGTWPSYQVCVTPAFVEQLKKAARETN